MLSIGDESWPAHYFTAPHTLYRDWGAVAKAEHLLGSRGSYIDIVQLHGSSVLGTRCLASGEDSAIHKRDNLELLRGRSTLDQLFILHKVD